MSNRDELVVFCSRTFEAQQTTRTVEGGELVFVEAMREEEVSSG
jgi:hypothetical protein